MQTTFRLVAADSAGVDADGRGVAAARAEPLSVGAGTAQPDLEEVDVTPLGEIADQNLGRRVELVGHDIEIAVPIEIEGDGRTRAERPGNGHTARAGGGGAAFDDHRRGGVA